MTNIPTTMRKSSVRIGKSATLTLDLCASIHDDFFLTFEQRLNFFILMTLDLIFILLFVL